MLEPIVIQQLYVQKVKNYHNITLVLKFARRGFHSEMFITFKYRDVRFQILIAFPMGLFNLNLKY